jgi:hypothetical protein
MMGEKVRRKIMAHYHCHAPPALRLLGIFALVLAAEAQVAAPFAQLNGSLRDTSGAALVKAGVGLLGLDTNHIYSTESGDDGFYLFSNLPSGHYQLSVDAPGFASYSQSGIVLSVGQKATIDLTLQIATHEVRIVVTQEAPPIEPSRTEVSQVIGSRQIEALPSLTRLFTDFVLLTPGVATGRTSLQSTITEFEVTRISFGGMRDLSNEVMVDGADAINTITGSQRAIPSQEAVSEFRVVNNSFGAEYGRALGGIVNVVTKSGTNSPHGSAYDYLQNNATDALSLLALPQFHTLRQNQFGGSFGGFIHRDKTFFFASYEGQRRAESPTYPAALVDDLGLINQAKVALGLTPENLNVLKTNHHDSGFVKIDQEVGANQWLSIRYNAEDGRDSNLLVGNTLDGGGIAAPSSGHDAQFRDQSLTGSFTSVLTPSLTNAVLFQYARRNYDFPGATGQPNLDIPNLLMFGHNYGIFDFMGESREQLSDSVSWNKGSHLLKAGFDGNFLQDKVTWPGFTPMRIVLPGINCLVEFANFVDPSANLKQNQLDGACPLPPALDGTPLVMWGAPVGSGPLVQGSLPPRLPTTWISAYLPSLTDDFNVNLNHSNHGLFVQDQWRAASRLTFNYGLRWDLENGLEKVIHPDYRNIAPRVGAAYALDSKTVIRAGFGLYFDRYNLSFVFVTDPERPVVIPGVQVPGVRQGAQSAGFVVNEMTPGPSGMPADAAKTLILSGQLPATYNSGPCPPNCTAGAGLVDPNSRNSYAEQSTFQIDREIAKGLTLSAGYLFVGAHHLVRAEDLNVAPPVGVLPDGKSLLGGALYNSGLLYYTDNSGNSVYDGATIEMSQRYGPYFQARASYTYSKTLDDGTFTTFVSAPQNLYERNLERANSNQDVRQRFVANFVATAPPNSFLRNFELSGIVTAQSPRPFTLFVGFDVNNANNPVTDRVGLSARNTYWGDDLQTADIRVSRFFRIAEHSKLMLSADAFNLLNRPNVDEVTTVYGAPDVIGAAPQRYKDGIGSPANPLFGEPRTMSNPRQLQFAMRLFF